MKALAKTGRVRTFEIVIEEKPMRPRRRSDVFQPISFAAALLVVLGALAAPAFADAPLPFDPDEAMEHQDDPPGIPAFVIHGTSAAATVSFGRFTSIQVNVNVAQANITGDAANEPSIAVDPTNPNNIAIGWRQFDTIASNFRQAGFGFSTNAGTTWTTGKIDPGIFRSDPVLGFDTQGKFFYNSLNNAFLCTVYPSTNGGATWGTGVAANGGDKQWMAIDRTAGLGHHQIYEAWSTASNPTPPNTFDRSINAGASYQAPSFIPNSPVWGTLDVAPNGTLYLVGTSGPGGTIYVARSTNAWDAAVTPPTFTTVPVNLGGTIQIGAMNPAGLLGQLWIAVDHSAGPRNGWVYVLASVRTATDPCDVMFIRSTDGGTNWGTPVRVNTDPTGTRAFHWFGTMGVSPDGRIDAVWNDTRASSDSTMSALYYSYSTDGGSTWSVNEQASPTWNATIGWPNQQKIGDYYHMISRTDGASLAWAATFNGEEDVYYLNIPFSTAAVARVPAPAFRLHRDLPNPFSVSATIRFDAPEGGGRARLEIFDAAGRRVATLVDGFVEGGVQSARWSGRDDAGRVVRSGLYLCRLDAGGTSESMKLMLLR